jgi:hypothetical protein
MSRDDYDDDYDDDREPREDEDRPRDPARASGKAVASLVLGLASFLLLCMTGVPAIIFGILGLSEVGRRPGRVGGRGLAIAGIVMGVIGTLATFAAVPLVLMIPAVSKVRSEAERTKTQANLKVIGAAFFASHAVTGKFPPAYLRTRDGQPGLSWRVAILPYIEQQALYKEFKLEEPWDSEHNKALLDRMPELYRAPGAEAGETSTHFRVLVGGGALFDERAPTGIGDIRDGISETLMVVEAADPVPWTKPEELEFDPKGPLPRLGHVTRGQFQALFADGAAKSVPTSLSNADLRALITRAAGDRAPDF